MRGRRPKPDAVANAENRPTRIGIMPEAKGDAHCPTWLSPDARAVWKRLAPMLRDMGVLTSIDAMAFARYCDASARWRTVSTFLAEHGELDGERARPEVKILRDLSAELLRLETEFGMTPASRLRLKGVQPKAKEESIEAFAAKKMLRLARETKPGA